MKTVLIAIIIALLYSNHDMRNFAASALRFTADFLETEEVKR
tara:strand:+ start:397 stop:522 length:126 start_codon:yes stop_codon:yes gene_type:complete